MGAGSQANPFDAPLASELQEHQQAQAATQAASPNGNPFDEPLASEKAEAQVKANTAPKDSVSPSSLLGTLGAMGRSPLRPTAQDTSFYQEHPGEATAAGVTGIAAPIVVDTAIAHLGSLTKIVQAAKALGWTTFGLKEAHDLYKMVTGPEKK